MKADINTIRKAICKNRGGYVKSSDAEIMRIWRILGADTRADYLESINQKGEERTSASTNKPE